MSTPPKTGGLFQTCHNSFVNGKAVVEDIYPSDTSKWVSSSRSDIYKGKHITMLNTSNMVRDLVLHVQLGDTLETSGKTPYIMNVPNHSYRAAVCVLSNAVRVE
jgi:hypothetical protein